MERGMFHISIARKFRDVQDGLSNSIAMGEMCVSDEKRNVGGYVFQVDAASWFPPRPLQCLNGGYVNANKPSLYGSGSLVARGRRWADGFWMNSAVSTVLPPNAPSCSRGSGAPDPNDGFASVASYHQGGAHVLFGDGAVKFITDSIDTGALNTSPVANGMTAPGSDSPYGLWGALGSIDANETRTLDQ